MIHIKSDLVLPINSSLNNLGIIDAHCGLLASFSAIKKENHKKNPFSNLNEFIIQLRQFMALEEAFCYVAFNKDISQLCNITKPELLLYENAVIEKNLPKDFIRQIFQPLVPKYFSKHEHPEKGKRCHKITKNIDILQANHPHLVDEVLDALNLPNKESGDIIMMRNRPIQSPEKFIKRVKLTNKFLHVSEEEKVANYIKESTDKKYSEYLSNSFSCECMFPLVGTLRDFPDQTVLYIMCYYRTPHQEDLSMIDKHLDNFIPSSLCNNDKILSILKQCAQDCNPNSHKCFVTKLLARQNESRGTCVVYFATFSKEVKKSNKDNFPIKRMYKYIKNELKDWDLYMGRVDYHSFPI